MRFEIKPRIIKIYKTTKQITNHLINHTYNTTFNKHTNIVQYAEHKKGFILIAFYVSYYLWVSLLPTKKKTNNHH